MHLPLWRKLSSGEKLLQNFNFIFGVVKRDMAQLNNAGTTQSRRGKFPRAAREIEDR